MTTIERLFAPSPCSVDDVAAAVRAAAGQPLAIGSDAAKNFCAALSHNLLNDEACRKIPALQALGFWLRASAVTTMALHYLRDSQGLRRMPGGTAFMIMPGNAESLIGYVAAIALLAGNVALMRLPREARLEQVQLLRCIEKTLAEADPAVQARLILIRTPHDDTITTALSSICDVRLIWGGDATVERLRRIPLPPLAREAVFADRYSACALDANAYNAADDGVRMRLAQQFANDLYAFDQLACASPRLLIWTGPERESIAAAGDFYPRVASRNYRPAAGGSAARLDAAYLAMHDLEVESFEQFGQGLTVVGLRHLHGMQAFRRVNYGYGLLLTARLGRLEELVAHVTARDQTLTLWGHGQQVVSGLIDACLGRGFNRIMPVGQALAFDPVWDGVNLFDVMTRLIRVGL